jgi:hypothetical protein
MTPGILWTFVPGSENWRPIAPSSGEGNPQPGVEAWPRATNKEK